MEKNQDSKCIFQGDFFYNSSAFLLSWPIQKYIQEMVIPFASVERLTLTDILNDKRVLFCKMNLYN